MTTESLETILLIFLLFYTVAMLGMSTWFSVKKNEKLLAEKSKSASYKWGYFWGYFSILAAPLFVFLLWFNPELKAFNVGLAPAFDKIFIEVLGGIGYVIIGVGLIKRMQLAWIASIAILGISFAFSLTQEANWLGLALALINGYYAWKRRQELTVISLSRKKK